MYDYCITKRIGENRFKDVFLANGICFSLSGERGGVMKRVHENIADQLISQKDFKIELIQCSKITEVVKALFA